MFYLLKYFQLDQVYVLETGAERIRRLWTVLRTNLLAGARYRPGVYEGDLTIFSATQGVGRDAVDTTLGWSRWVSGKAEAVAVPGDHAGILKSPGVQVLAKELRDRLARPAGGT